MKNNATYGISKYALRDAVAVITMTRTEYERTDSGKSWARKPVDTETATVSAENYYNCVDAIPFFRNLGGTERVERGYTAFGYIPVRLTSVSPDRKRKIVREWRFAEKAR